MQPVLTRRSFLAALALGPLAAVGLLSAAKDPEPAAPTPTVRNTRRRVVARPDALAWSSPDTYFYLAG